MRQTFLLHFRNTVTRYDPKKLRIFGFVISELHAVLRRKIRKFVMSIGTCLEVTDGVTEKGQSHHLPARVCGTLEVCAASTAPRR